MASSVSVVPGFRFLPGTTDLILVASVEAVAVASRYRQEPGARWMVLRPDQVRAEARARIVERGGDPKNDHAVLAESQLQFGQYRGQTFQWLLGNDVGYACSVISSHEKEREGGDPTLSPLMVNKDALVSYARLFPPMVTAIARRRMREGSQSMGGLDDKLVGFGQHGHRTFKSLYEAKDRESQT